MSAWMSRNRRTSKTSKVGDENGVGKAWYGVRGHVRPVTDLCGDTARVKNDDMRGRRKWKEGEKIWGNVRHKEFSQGESSGGEVQWCWMTVSKDTLLLTWLELCEGARRHPRVLIRQTHMTAFTSLLATNPQAGE